MNEKIKTLQTALDKLNANEHTIYFLVYDTKNNPRASLKHIYDMAHTLLKNGFNVKLLADNKSYSGVSQWLDGVYDDLEVVVITEQKVEISVDDIVVVPEYYSNILEQMANMNCVKVMLCQQKDYIFENLPMGSRWSNFGFDRVITTGENVKKYILSLFPESLVFVIPPLIGEQFKPSKKNIKPYIAISCRDRTLHKRLVSEFYLKFPLLRWITFVDMTQKTYQQFAESLSDCMVSLWVDDESTFGTFPLESMKCNVPVVGKVPDMEPDWLGENGMWTYDTNELIGMLGSYVLSWIESEVLIDDVKEAMNETLLPYDSTITENNIVSIFNSFKNTRVESLKKAIKKLEEE